MNNPSASQRIVRRHGSPGLVGRCCGWGASLLLVLLLNSGFAAPEQEEAKFDPQLRLSSYQPTSTRDPFLPAHAKVSSTVVSAGQGEFRLQGLLYDSTSPAAIVNDQMVILNKPTILLTTLGPVEVKAIEINRRRVVLDVGGEKVDLPFETAGR
ncbi:hypothetical protein HQ590_09700 [bacterium]|nr:hypothetical protein [bacterium]